MAKADVGTRSSFTRREFLQASAAASLGLALPAMSNANAALRHEANVIVLFLVGGPSHIDTWDPKPNAPSGIRGPFRPIATNVPGIQISELFPRMPRHADKYSLIRTVHHSATAIHETGQQMLQTGRLSGPDRQGGANERWDSEPLDFPHAGSVLSYFKGGRGNMPASVLVPFPMGQTGADLSHGQTAGFLGRRHDPKLLAPATISGRLWLSRQPARLRERYGRSQFGESCLLARCLIEAGVRFVTVNMFETVFNQATWDIHGFRPFSDMTDMAHWVAPCFDQAFSALLEDLSERGLLATTVVTAMGEFGRTPKINAAGGRDHHTGVWTILMGGGPIHGGRIVGESDEWGYVPKSRPVTPAEVLATIYHAAGVDCRSKLPLSQNRFVSIIDPGIEPIQELL
jgi:hypothetical protein